jgi:eukaryotic-like serine/threonine-protein kinase
MSTHEVDVAGRYRLLERIGAGGMGVVWRGYDERLGRDVAVKRLLAVPTPDDAEADVAAHRAMREARITARLHHPHAVGVYDVVEHEGQPCLVMEYFPSSSLADVAAAGRRLSVDEVARIGGEVASALAAAHRAGIVHRDVKPGNVLVADDGVAKISDFGISHALGDVSLTSTGLVTGTPAYLAPEVARGEPATPASDVFSLGSTLYTALEGRPPFGRHENPMAVLHRVASGQVDPPSRSGRLTGLLVSMLAARPEDRPSMLEVARLLSDGALPVAEEAAPMRTGPVPDDAPDDVPDDVPDGTADDPLWAFRDAPPAVATAGVAVERRRVPRLVLTLLVLVLAAAVAVALASRHDGQPDATATTRGSASTSPSVIATASPSVTPRTTAPTTASAPSPTPAPSTSAPRTSPPPSRAPTAPVGGTPTAAQLRTALVDYYALLPGNRDAGWGRLTPHYQRTTATSRDYYESFWSAIDAVRVSDVSASAPHTVTATVTYDYEDGRVYVERTRYRLVEDDGILKIDRSEVLSSVQR